MKYLIDTHVILWFLAKDKSLSNKAKDIIESSNEIYVSIVSLWEISIKHSINKLDIMLPNMNLFIEDYIYAQYARLSGLFARVCRHVSRHVPTKTRANTPLCARLSLRDTPGERSRAFSLHSAIFLAIMIYVCDVAIIV